MSETVDQQSIKITNKSIADRYVISSERLPTQTFISGANLDAKTSDLKALSLSRSHVGRLSFLSTCNPHLARPANFLSSAQHYDPHFCARAAEDLILASQIRPFSIPFYKNFRDVIAIYSDSSHSVPTCKAVSGTLIQLQDSDDPSPMSNVVTWSSNTLASLYNSAYAAESKGVSNSIEVFLSVKKDIFSTFPERTFKIVLFVDNKGLVDTLLSTRPANPFSSNIVDFCREWIEKENMIVKWVPTALNLADQLTKFKKWW